MSISDALLKQVQANAARNASYRDDVAVSLAPTDPLVRLIAFYLPQFHPIPENDLWWGKGFTEWTNVSRAVPQFVGHYQPRLPGELGFYDLRLPETLRRQAELAKKYGIHGFCLHYYWFAGKILLGAPLKLLLEHREIDLNFCICWANENWTRSWDGLERDVLLAQQHSPEDDVAFARALEPAFRDSRYIRIDGRPLLVVYRPGLLPDPLATARRWRHHFARAGLGNPYLVMAQCFGDVDPRPFGFDAAVEFPPHKLSEGAPSLNSTLEIFDPAYQGTNYDYEYVTNQALTRPTTPFPLFPGVCPGWDNEARKPGRGITFAFSTPAKYGAWLEHACRRATNELRPSERFVFINAWNEWAEGAYLEPDRHFGYAYLHETANVLDRLDNRMPAAASIGLVAVVHDACMGGAQVLALRLIELCIRQFGLRVHVLLGAGGELETAFHELAPTERFSNGFADRRALRSVAEGLARQGFTAALFNSVASGPAIEPLRAAGMRCVALVNELPSLMRQYKLENAAAIVARQADAAVFPAAFVRDHFEQYAGPVTAYSVVRPQGLFRTPARSAELSRLRETARRQLRIPAEAPVVLGVANGDLRKGVDLWPIFARGVLARQPDTYFVWVGGIEPDLALWIRHDMEVMGYPGRLITPGSVADLNPLYAMADVFVLSSREDPFPSVMLDAMAHGLPLVGFEGSGGVSDVARAGGGLTVPYLDMPAMTDAICRLLNNKRERAAIGEAGREIIARDFDFADYGFNMLQLADQALRKVSVIVPNFNYAGYLKQRLESIWLQSYPVYEVIVLDDASTDDSVAVIADLQRQSGRRIRLVRNEVNSGSVSRQWARGLHMSRGDLIWIAEADDFADPDFLATVVAPFNEPDTVLSYCQSRQVNEQGIVLADNYIDYTADVDPLRWQQDYRRSGETEIGDALSVKNTIPNVSAVVFRRDALTGVLQNHLEEMAGLRNAADWLCYLRLMTRGAVSFTARSLNNHRRHQRGTTLSSSDRRHLDEIILMQQLAGELAAISPERQAAARHWRDAVAVQFGIEKPGDSLATARDLDQHGRSPSPGPRLYIGAGSMSPLSDDAWLNLLRRAAAGDCVELNGRPLPNAPDVQLQINTVGQSGPDATDEAWVFAALCLARFRTSSLFKNEHKSLLDFGTGWARIARCFLRDIRAENIIGVDVDPGLVTVCQTTFPGPLFLNCNPMPPLGLRHASVDFVVGYSVFSHLSEAACRAWLAEFARVLKPGGMAALTTRGRWFFDYAASLADASPGSQALSTMFPDFSEARARYDRGAFVHSNMPGVTGGGVLDGSFYGETFIPERFARETLGRILPLREFHAGGGHPVMFFEKPR